MCSLRDAATSFQKQSVRVCGVSLDSVKELEAFAKAQKLGFPLLSDPDGSVADKYAVRMAGRPFARRVTFVIDEKGVLRAVLDQVKVDSHGADLLALVEQLRAG